MHGIYTKAKRTKVEGPRFVVVVYLLFVTFYVFLLYSYCTEYDLSVSFIYSKQRLLFNSNKQFRELNLVLIRGCASMNACVLMYVCSSQLILELSWDYKDD